MVAGLILLAFVLGGVLAFVMAKRPRLDRDWVEHLAVMPAIEITEARFTLAPATDYSFSPSGAATPAYTSASEAFDDLKDIWFVVEPQPGQPYAAHTLVIFEFKQEHMIGLTIEARLHGKQKYSAVDGMFNNYELSYIWSTPKDLLTRRVVKLGKELYVYPLKLTQKQKEDFLRATLKQTLRINSEPRFYNTLTSNCTNELAKTAGLDWHYSWVLTGYAAKHLWETKMIPGETFEAVQEKAKVTRDIKGWNNLSSHDFDLALLKKLHADAAIGQNEAAKRLR